MFRSSYAEPAADRLRRLASFMLRLCALEGRASGAYRRRYQSRRRALLISARDRPFSLAGIDGRGFDDRSLRVHRLPSAGDRHGQVLADLELRVRDGECPDASCARAIGRHSVLRLFPSRGGLCLSCARVPRGRNVGSPGQEEARSVATQLLAAGGLEDAGIVAELVEQHFGSLNTALNETHERLDSVIGAQAATLLVAVQQVCVELLRSKIDERALIDTPSALVDYLRFRFGYRASEAVGVIYLSSSDRIIGEEIAFMGSVQTAPMHAREIVRRALELCSTSIILFHNHPSGDPTPSAADLAATRSVAEAARLFDIQLCDHIILSRSSWKSFRSEGLL